MTNKEAKEMCKKIATMESELAAMKKAFSKKMVNRSPQKLPCNIEEFCKHIEDDGLPEDLIAGDYIDFELLTGEPVRAYVCGVCHDKAIDDTMTDYTFAITRLDGDFEMNTKCDNSTSWENSKGRIYAERIFNILPECLQDVIIRAKKLTSAGNKSKNIIETNDALFLFSEVEVFGKTNYSVTGEGEQYEFFKSAENIKKVFTKYAWLRSPCSDSSNYFCNVSSFGDAIYSIASYAGGLVFGFCV